MNPVINVLCTGAICAAITDHPVLMWVCLGCAAVAAIAREALE